MKIFRCIERRKGEPTGVVLYVEDGVEKGTRFDKEWNDATVLKHFGIVKPQEIPVGAAKGKSK